MHRRHRSRKQGGRRRRRTNRRRNRSFSRRNQEFQQQEQQQYQHQQQGGDCGCNAKFPGFSGGRRSSNKQNKKSFRGGGFVDSLINNVTGDFFYNGNGGQQVASGFGTSNGAQYGYGYLTGNPNIGGNYKMPFAEQVQMA